MKILAFAYACEPQKGSEPGAGWAWVRMLARKGDTWVITRRNNRDAIEAELPLIPERERLHFEYVDLPGWAMRWKRGQRGVRLYYLLWQGAALRRAHHLHAVTQFDLVWHLTLANAWLGSVGQFVGPPFIYGPVGGGVRFPWNLFSVLGFEGVLREALRSAARQAGRYLNPLARSAWRRASLILAQNPETRTWFPPQVRARTRVFPNAFWDGSPNPREDEPGGRAALFAGRLLPWKGISLALRAVRDAPDWELSVAGEGPDKRRLRRLAASLGVAERVRFLGWVERDELHSLIHNRTDILLLPSVREDASLVVAEAVAQGCPVLCLDRGGPPVVGGAAAAVIPIRGSAGKVAVRLARALRERQFPSQNVVRQRAEELTLDRRYEALERLVSSAVAVSPRLQQRQSSTNEAQG